MASFIRVGNRLVNPKAPKSDAALDTLRGAYEQHEQYETYVEPGRDSHERRAPGISSGASLDAPRGRGD